MGEGLGIMAPLLGQLRIPWGGLTRRLAYATLAVLYTWLYAGLDDEVPCRITGGVRHIVHFIDLSQTSQ